MLKRLLNANHEFVFINPDGVVAVEPCTGSPKPYSMIITRDGSKFQVRGTASDIASELGLLEMEDKR